MTKDQGVISDEELARQIADLARAVNDALRAASEANDKLIQLADQARGSGLVADLLRSGHPSVAAVVGVRVERVTYSTILHEHVPAGGVLGPVAA